MGVWAVKAAKSEGRAHVYIRMPECGSNKLVMHSAQHRSDPCASRAFLQPLRGPQQCPVPPPILVRFGDARSH